MLTLYCLHVAKLMALYLDAAAVLEAGPRKGSLKSRIYSSQTRGAKPAQTYALITECAKFDSFLKEVIDNAGLLEQEPKVFFLPVTQSLC